MMSIYDLVAIDVETSKLDSRYSLEKYSTKIICIYPWIVLYLIIYHVDLCRSCVLDP